MHFVGRVDWSFADSPAVADHSHGLARQVLVGPAQGAVHTELAVGALQPGGWLQRHFHSFEEALYVLGGRAAPRARRPRRTGCVPGDFALYPDRDVARARQRRPSRSAGCRVNTPQRLAPDAGRKDTFFAAGPFDLAALDARRQRPPFGDPRLRWVGHYDGTPPQAEALRARPTRRAAGEPVGTRHRADRLQRDLREDARRPGLRRRAADDVHRRLRAGRLGAGPRPPVRGDLLLPRRRDRGGARRTRSTRIRAGDVVFSGVGADPRLLQQRHRAGPLDRDAGAAAAGAPLVPVGRPLEATSRKEWTDHGSRRLRRRHRRDRGHRPGDRAALRRCRAHDVVITGRDAGGAEQVAAEIGGSTRGIGLDLAEPKPIARRAAVGRAGALPRDRRDRARREPVQRLRHRARDVPRDAEARRATPRSSTSCSIGWATTARSSSSAAWPRTARTRARRRSRPSTAASSGSSARSSASSHRGASTRSTPASWRTARTGRARTSTGSDPARRPAG